MVRKSVSITLIWGGSLPEGSRFSGEWIGIAVRGLCRGDEELGEYRLGTGVVVVHYHQGWNEKKKKFG